MQFYKRNAYITISKATIYKEASMTFTKTTTLTAALAFAALLTASMSLQAAKVTIDNTRPRYDTNGELMDAHDGEICCFDSTYYFYGTRYNNEDGTSAYNRVYCYSSPDLVTWTNHGDVLPERNIPNSKYWGTYWRQHVNYNERTRKYVLIGDLGYYWQLHLYAATADNPWGPFALQNILWDKTVIDFDPFVDEDGTAYILGINNFNPARIIKLTGDYLHWDSTASIADPPFGGDAYTVFKRGPWYYYGTGVPLYYGVSPNTFYKSSNIRGPWAGPSCGQIFIGQGMCVPEIMTPTGPEHIYVGDDWGAWKGCTLGKACDYVGIGMPIQFDASGNIVSRNYYADSFTIDIIGKPSPGPRAPKNYALGKAVTASSSQESGGWSKDFLTDGKEFSVSRSSPTCMGWRSNGSTGSNHTEWVQIDLGILRAIDAVELYPKVWNSKVSEIYNDDPNAGEGFPKSFSVRVSQDNSNWTAAGQVTNLPNPKSLPQKVSFTATLARHVRVEMTDLATVGGQYVAQLTEVKVFEAVAGTTVMRSSDPSISRPAFGIRAVHSGLSTITIRCSLPRDASNGACRLTVYDTRGRLVRSLAAASARGETAFAIQGLAYGRYVFRIESANLTMQAFAMVAIQ